MAGVTPRIRWVSLLASTGSLLALYTIMVAIAYNSLFILQRGIELLIVTSMLSFYSLGAAMQMLRRNPLLEDIGEAVVAGMVVVGVSASLLYTPVIAAIASLVERRLRIIVEETGVVLTPRTRLVKRPVVAALASLLFAPLIGYEAGVVLESSIGLSTVLSLELLPATLVSRRGVSSGEA